MNRGLIIWGKSTRIERLMMDQGKALNKSMAAFIYLFIFPIKNGKASQRV